MPKAFLTGATGFVGSHLAEELLRRGYDEVRCLVRTNEKWLKGQPVTIVKGDLSDVDVLWEAIQGVDYVYHVAGVTRARDWETFYSANVQGTLNLLGVVEKSAPGVRRVLITSSLAAVGACYEEVATEETPLRPVSRYGRSKAEMERALQEPTEDGKSYAEKLPITVVRPAAVYGPREADIFTFFKTVSRGICPIVGGNSNEPALSLVHVRDLVRGMVDAAEADNTIGETYFLGSENAYGWQEVKNAATTALGRSAITIPVPKALIYAVGAASEQWGKLTGAYPSLNREKAREIREACTMCSIEKAQRDFGYQPKIPLEKGVAESIAWYRKEGWL